MLNLPAWKIAVPSPILLLMFGHPVDGLPETRVKRRRTIVNIEHLMKPSKWVTLNCYRALLGTGDLEVPRTYAR